LGTGDTDFIFGLLYISNGRAIGMVVMSLSVCRLSVTDVLWLMGRQGLGENFSHG